MTEKQYRLNKWGTRLLKNNRPLFDWTNEPDEIVDLLNKLNDKNGQLKHRIKKLQNELDNYSEIFNELNALVDENENLKKQIEEYTNPDKYILIKKTENSTEEYNSCPDCQHYEREYEEVIAFGEYETLTKEICNKGHDIEDTDANKCNDYEYNEF